MKVGDIILHDSGYGDGKKFKYKIIYIWKNYWGFDWWYDLEADCFCKIS